MINDVTGVQLDPTNERFTSVEGGVRFETADRSFNVSAGLYSTRWRDRTIAGVTETSGDTIAAYVRGVNSNYHGVELESAWQPHRMVRVDVAASFGNWYYTSDSPFESFNVSTGEPEGIAGQLYLKSLKVGDMPQSQVAYGLSVFPLKGLSLRFQGRWYDRYWADYLPESRTNPNDRAQPWKIPSYTIYDPHESYRLPLRSEKFEVSVFARLSNIFDKTYVSDATDERSFEAAGTNLTSLVNAD